MPSLFEQDLEACKFRLEGLTDGTPGMEFTVSESTDELLVELGQRLIGLGKHAEAWRVVPESLGWLTLWSRAIAIADATRAAYGGNSSFGAQLIWRAGFELQYHLTVISDPLRIRWPEAAENGCPESEMSANDRLCAYVAYCLWNDSRHFDTLTKGWLLNSVWNDDQSVPLSDTLKSMTSILKNSQEDQDPRAARNQNRDWAMRQRNRTQSWLKHPRLARWVQTLHAINLGRGPNTFYGVLNPRRDSLGKDTFKTQFEVATPEYGRVSALLHGSTIEDYLYIGDGNIFPTAGSGRDLDREVRHNIYTLMMCWLLLNSLAQNVTEAAIDRTEATDP